MSGASSRSERGWSRVGLIRPVRREPSSVGPRRWEGPEPHTTAKRRNKFTVGVIFAKRRDRDNLFAEYGGIDYQRYPRVSFLSFSPIVWIMDPLCGRLLLFPRALYYRQRACDPWKRIDLWKRAIKELTEKGCQLRKRHWFFNGIYWRTEMRLSIIININEYRVFQT